MRRHTFHIGLYGLLLSFAVFADTLDFLGSIWITVSVGSVLGITVVALGIMMLLVAILIKLFIGLTTFVSIKLGPRKIASMIISFIIEISPLGFLPVTTIGLMVVQTIGKWEERREKKKERKEAKDNSPVGYAQAY